MLICGSCKKDELTLHPSDINQKELVASWNLDSYKFHITHYNTQNDDNSSTVIQGKSIASDAVMQFKSDNTIECSGTYEIEYDLESGNSSKIMLTPTTESSYSFKSKSINTPKIIFKTNGNQTAKDNAHYMYIVSISSTKLELSNSYSYTQDGIEYRVNGSLKFTKL